MSEIAVADWPEGYAVRVFDEVSSTLDLAREMLDDLAGPTWLLALRQTAARGRRGRPWRQGPGNFAATLVLPIKDDPASLALRSFVAALAVQDAIAEVAGSVHGLALKWPNDVLLNAGKVAGILLETLGPGAQPSHLAIGVGVNLISAPGPDLMDPGALSPVSIAQETGVVVSPQEFLGALARSYAACEAQFTTLGFEPIRTAWRARAVKLGETITARTSNESFTGTFLDVDKSGQLVLETANGRLTLPAADLYF